MGDLYIHESARIQKSEYGIIKAFRNVCVVDSVLRDNVIIGDESVIERCRVGNYVSVNRRNYINDSCIGDFSYTGINTIINFAKIGRFCSIARNVDIGGMDHDMDYVSTIPRFRIEQALCGSKPVAPKMAHCSIGNDVWIATGAIVLNKANIGDGAIIGAGAVVTKDIPPYAIAVGVPAKVIGYRCSSELMEELIELQWWNFPLEVIKENVNLLLNEKLSYDVIDKLKRIKESVQNG